MRYRIALLAIFAVGATYAGILAGPDHAGNPICREEREKLLQTAKIVIENLEQKNAVLELKVASLEAELSKSKPKVTGVK